MRYAALFLLCVTALPLAAQATFPIVNAGFEANVVADGTFQNLSPSGWSGSGIFVFVVNPNVSQLVLEAPEGANVGSLGDNTSISQTVNGPFTAEHTYTLSWRVMNVAPYGANHPYDCVISANGVEIAHDYKFSPLNYDDVRLATTSFTMPAGAPTIAAIEIKLSRGNFGGNVYFDQFRLTESAPYVNAVQDAFVDYECYATGSMLPPNFGCENSQEGLGKTRIASAPVLGSVDGFPTHGQKWVEVSSVQTGPNSGAPLSTALDTYFYAASPRIAFDWKALTGESVPSGPNFIDAVEWFLFDLSTGLFVGISNGTLTTTDIAADWTNTTPTYTSPMTGSFNDQTLPKTMTIDIPQNLIGRRMMISVRVGNGGDNNVDTAVFVDNFRYVMPASRPGSDDDLRMGTAIDSIAHLSGGGGNDEKSIAGFQTLHIGVDSDTFYFSPIILAVQFFVTGGAQPSPIALYDLWVNTGAIVLLNGSIPGPFGATHAIVPGGSIFSYTIPNGAGGNSMILQTVVPNTLSANGVIATSEAHVIKFL